MKFLKVGRVAIITHGRYAGKKVRENSELTVTSTRCIKRGTRIGGRAESDNDDDVFWQRLSKVLGIGFCGEINSVQTED